MDPLFPMAVSAAAVLVTLAYASYLDIRDRRVPFVFWLPMLAVGLCCTGFMLWQTSANAGLVVAYISLVTCFLYADYLDNRGRTDSLYLTRYYAKGCIWYYLALVLVLPALSWFVLGPPLTMQLAGWYFLFALIFCMVSWMEAQGRFDGPASTAGKGSSVADIVGRWYFLLIILIHVMVAVSFITANVWNMNEGLFILLPAVFAGVFYTFGRMHLFGGADAWALIFMAFCVPTFPATPILGIPPLGFLAFSALINALLLNLVAPLGIFVINLVRGNRAPLMYLFFGFPVSGESIQKEWGFVMEDFAMKDGVLTRKFIGFWDAIRRMYMGRDRIYTKDLREHPEHYRKELSMYRKAGTVWISYAVPFIIPIMAGFLSAIVFGDFLLAIMSMLISG
jgi:preflagellin peptidase FlaK